MLILRILVYSSWKSFWKIGLYFSLLFTMNYMHASNQSAPNFPTDMYASRTLLRSFLCMLCHQQDNSVPSPQLISAMIVWQPACVDYQRDIDWPLHFYLYIYAETSTEYYPPTEDEEVESRETVRLCLTKPERVKGQACFRSVRRIEKRSAEING